jgi:hypothetical protein
LIRQALSQLEEGRDALNDTISVMQTMIDGDGSQASQFTYVTGKYGFPDDATSMAAWNELNSLAFKLNTNASITDMMNALLQAFSKFR